MPSENSESQESKTKRNLRSNKEADDETSAKEDLKSEEIVKLKNVELPAAVTEAFTDNQENKSKKKGQPKKENQTSTNDLKNEVTVKLEVIETEADIDIMETDPSSASPEVLDEKQQSRYGRVRKNRSLGPDMQMEPLVKSKPIKESTPTKEDSQNSPNAPKKTPHPSFSKAKVDKILNGLTLTEEFKLGDLIWARIPGHPWWPCIISEDPVKKTYIKSRNRKAVKDGGTTYHVNYFGKGTQRGWTMTKNVLVFEGKDRLDEYVKALVDESPDDQKEVINFLFRVPQSRLTTWTEAVLEAEKYIKFSADERLEKLVPIFAQANATKSTQLSEKTTPTKDLYHLKSEVANSAAKKGTEKSEEVLSKYKMKIYFENYLSEHLDDMIDGGLTDKEARDLLTIKWEEFSDQEKEVYKKRKRKISNSRVTPPLKEKLRTYSTKVEPIPKKKQLAGPASKTGRHLNFNAPGKILAKPNNTQNNVKKSKEECVPTSNNVLPSDYANLLLPGIKGASPRKVAVFIIESDSSSDSGLEDDKPGVDNESKEVTKPMNNENKVHSKGDKTEQTKLRNGKQIQVQDEVKGKPDSNKVPKETSNKLVNGASVEASETKLKNNNIEPVTDALGEEKRNFITKIKNIEVKDIKVANTIVKKSIKKTGDGSNLVKQIAKQLKGTFKKDKSDTGESRIANTRPKRVLMEKSKSNNFRKLTEKSPLVEEEVNSDEGNTSKLLEDQICKGELNSKNTLTSNGEKPIVPNEKIKESLDAMKEDSCWDVSLFLSESSENSSVAPSLVSPALNATTSSIKKNDEEQRQQNCNEIIESVGLKKISPVEKGESNNASINDNGKKTGRIGTRRYVKSRMDEVDNKSRKNEEQLNGEKFPTDLETGAEDVPPPKKPKVQESNNKASAKPKARLLKNKQIEDNKLEPKKKTISQSSEETVSCEENKTKPTCNVSEIRVEDENKLKKSCIKSSNAAAEDSKIDLMTINSSKASLPTTEAQVEDKVAKQFKGRGRLRKNKEDLPTDTSANLLPIDICSNILPSDASANLLSTKMSTNLLPTDISAKTLPSKNENALNENDYDPDSQKTVLHNSKSDFCPLTARKRKGPQSNADIAFNKYLHNNILDVMGSNPELSYSETKAVLLNKWEKMTEEEKVSYQSTKDDTKENVNSTQIKKAKLMIKTLEGLESEEEEIQIESVDCETGAVLNRHDRLCQICEVSGDVVTCKGPCQQNFHLGCLNHKPENLATFQCDECANNCHTCFSCKSNQGEVRKCTISNCGKFYHETCLRQSPLSTVMENRIICPLHVCLSCYNENPKLARTHKGRLVRCIRCPTAFHSIEGCVAAGSIQLTQSHILCTHHFTPKKSNKHHSHINVNWCFICSAGGELICCESCPGAFHAECLEIVPPEESFYCQDCKRRKHPTSGNIIWVKLGCYRWWPAEVCHPNGVPLNIQKLEHSVGEFPVRFFGSHDYFWVHKGRVFLFQDGDKGSRDYTSNRYLAKVFQRAVDEATVAFKNWLKTKRAREVNHNSSKPPSYKHIKLNKPVGKVQIHVVDTASLTRCECDPNAENPCARDTDCLNRLLHLECHPSVCPAGDKCQNQDFVKRNYPLAVPRKVEGRGWGLFSQINISKGQFVSEYVGELIDEEECQNRLKNMHAENDTNFYFLTIDKDRIIDAGPKGNLSRFMNHSCQPNCETQKWMVNGDTRVGLFASEDIESGAELTFNYNLECRGDEKTKCGCGAPNCSGFIGVRPKTPAAISAEKKFKENIGKKKKKKVAATRKHEDECYRCGEGGELLMCDRKNCTKSYHLFCLKLDKPPHGRWECPWHHCDSCGRPSVMLCMDCPNSYCSVHATPEVISPTGERVLCSDHAVALELENQVVVDVEKITNDSSV